MFGLTGRRRKHLREQPFPAEWEEILHRTMPLYASLSAEDRRELQGHVQVFLDEKSFEGCGGLLVTNEIRVTIAAQACVLLLHRETDYYPELLSILVYPHAYIVKETRHDGSVVIDGEVTRLGESWVRGAVVLAWDNVLAGAADVHDGHNVVFHEFAHQLDQEDGAGDGAPVLPRRSMYVTWARVLGGEFAHLQQAARRGEPTLLDKYGATNPAEMFAVATETFFEKPRKLRSRHPELYEQLKEFYNQDPAERPGV